MLVTQSNLESSVEEILLEKIIAVDTETTGLRPFHGDVPFAIVIATESKVYYFNLNAYPEVEPLVGFEESLKRIFLNSSIHKIFMNATFDMHMLATIGFFIEGNILDLKFLARLENNSHYKYSLDDIAKRRGLEKLDVAKKYAKEHKLVERFKDENLNKEWDSLHYELIPLDVFQPYGEVDGRLTYDIALSILRKIQADDLTKAINRPKEMSVVDNESRLTKTIHKMESMGVKIDVKYCEEAMAYYKDVLLTCEAEFKNLTGEDFVKGETVFKKVFADETWAFTEKGNPRFDADTIATFKSPAAKHVIDYSEAKKQLEYFQNFLFFADSEGVVHASFDQAGTLTGRFSSRGPNLQNLSNPDKYEEDAAGSKYPVRRAFIPRQGYIFVMPDFSQIEYRVMLDRARAQGLIVKIRDQGLDVHTATAEVARVSRKDAKTVNFLTLYGGGIKKLASDLKCTVQRARDIQNAIFSAAPEILVFTTEVKRRAEERGFIFNWLGRKLLFPDKKFCYKSPNNLIQGDCADILKVAMNRIDDFLEGTKSRMLLTIHDELVFEIFQGEEYLVRGIKKIMESVFPFRHLPLLVEVEFSSKNLADKLPWDDEKYSHGEAKRNSAQRESPSQAQSFT